MEEQKIAAATGALIASLISAAICVLIVLAAWNLVLVDALGVNPVKWWQALLLLLFIRVANPTKVNKE